MTGNIDVRSGWNFHSSHGSPGGLGKSGGWGVLSLVVKQRRPAGRTVVATVKHVLLSVRDIPETVDFLLLV